MGNVKYNKVVACFVVGILRRARRTVPGTVYIPVPYSAVPHLLVRRVYALPAGIIPEV